jgi:hypothetical protein
MEIVVRATYADSTIFIQDSQFPNVVAQFFWQAM